VVQHLPIIPALLGVQEIECMSYQLPTFRQNGMLVGFGATVKHCAFYVMRLSTVEANKDEIKDYYTRKGNINFQCDIINPITTPAHTPRCWVHCDACAKQP